MNLLFNIQKKRELFTTTLIEYGEEGYTAMAKTVGVPVAVAAQLILDGRIKSRGVYAPLIPEIYEPLYELLKDEDIKFLQSTKTIPTTEPEQKSEIKRQIADIHAVVEHLHSDAESVVITHEESTVKTEQTKTETLPITTPTSIVVIANEESKTETLPITTPTPIVVITHEESTVKTEQTKTETLPITTPTSIVVIANEESKTETPIAEVPTEKTEEPTS